MKNYCLILAILLLVMVDSTRGLAQRAIHVMTTNNYAVQVGAFKTLDNAIALRFTMDATFSGFGTEIVSENGWYKVVVGGEWNNDTAVLMRDHLNFYGIAAGAFLIKNEGRTAPVFRVYNL